MLAGLGLIFGGAAQAAPTRVASLNLCTDELLLTLAAPGQIVSVTHLSQQPAETPLWQRARHHPRNDGSLLSVTKWRPDLVLTMGGGARDRMRIAARLGIPMIDLPFPTSMADVESAILIVAKALGRPAAGRDLLGRLRRQRQAMPQQTVDTLWLGGGGRSVPASGLASQWMRLAGLRQRSLRGDRVSLEQLLAYPPVIILRSDYRSGQYSGEQRWLDHPLAKNSGRSRTLTTDGRRWTCMGPPMIEEIARLRVAAQR